MSNVLTIYIPNLDGTTSMYEAFTQKVSSPDGSFEYKVVDTMDHATSNRLHHAALAVNAFGQYIPKMYDEEGVSNAILVDIQTTRTYRDGKGKKHEAPMLWAGVVNTYYAQFQKIANLILHGHHVEFMFDGLSVNLSVPPAEIVETCRLAQVKYLRVDKGYAKLHDPVLRELAAFVQSGMKKQLTDYLRAGFETEFFRAQPQLVAMRIINDAILDLLQKYDDVNLAEESAAYAALLLKSFEHKPGLPNQEVTTNQLPNINHKMKFGSFISSGARGGKAYNGEHWTSDTDGTYVDAPAAQLEADIVNAWYYEHEEFRIPTRDELQEEYDNLSLEYEDLKHKLRQLNRNAARCDKGFRQFILKFARLQELSDILGTEPHGNIEDLARVLPIQFR